MAGFRTLSAIVDLPGPSQPQVSNRAEILSAVVLWLVGSPDNSQRPAITRKRFSSRSDRKDALTLFAGISSGFCANFRPANLSKSDLRKRAHSYRSVGGSAYTVFGHSTTMKFQSKGNPSLHHPRG